VSNSNYPQPATL